MTWYEWLCLFSVPSILFFIFTILWNKLSTHINRSKNDDTTLKLGVQALLRDRLMQGYRYFIAQGEISIADKQNYDNMYQRYHELGKNGVMDSMHNEIMDLPIKQ